METQNRSDPNEDIDVSIYSEKMLKQKLIEQYGESINFSEKAGTRNVITNVEEIIDEKWYQNRCVNIQDEADRIIKAAAQIIFGEINSKNYNTDLYPSTDDIRDLEKGKEWLPRTLQIFLRTLIKSEIKQVSIGQCILRATMSRSYIPPLRFGLGVELDHVFGSKWLITELARLGYCVSPDEVLLFKQYAVQAEPDEVSEFECYPSKFTQSVGDNIDHNLVTLDGIPWDGSDFYFLFSDEHC